jgi:hypothetical protein
MQKMQMFLVAFINVKLILKQKKKVILCPIIRKNIAYKLKEKESPVGFVF